MVNLAGSAQALPSHYDHVVRWLQEACRRYSLRAVCAAFGSIVDTQPLRVAADGSAPVDWSRSALPQRATCESTTIRSAGWEWEWQHGRLIGSAVIAREPVTIALDVDADGAKADLEMLVVPAFEQEFAPLLERWFVATRKAAASMMDVMNTLELCAFLVTCSGRVLVQSHAADQLVRGHVGLHLLSGRLNCVDADDQRHLVTTLKQICTEPNERARRALAVGRDDDALAIDVMPIRTAEPGHFGAAALLVVRQAPIKPIDDQVDVVRHIFDLTAAEARLALDLATGMSLASIATARSLSRETLRSRLKRVFQKMGVTRQAELVAKLQSTIGGVRNRESSLVISDDPFGGCDSAQSESIRTLSGR